MGLLKCPDCGKMVSQRAESCPECGCPSKYFISDNDEVDYENQPEPDKQESVEDDSIAVVDKLFWCFTRVYDWHDIQIINKAVKHDLQQRLKTDYQVTIVGDDNVEECVSKINREELELPYIVVHAGFVYSIGETRKYKCIVNGSEEKDLYFDEKHLPVTYRAMFEIFAENENQLSALKEQITTIYKEDVILNIPLFGSDEQMIPVNVKFDVSDDTEVLDSFNNTEAYKCTVQGVKNIWPHCIDIPFNKIDNRAMANYRMVQLAQCCAVYLGFWGDVKQEIKLYGRLFEQVGFLKQAFGPISTEQYKDLKARITNGQQFNSDLVDGAFPRASLLYHNFPNDIAARVPVDSVKEKVTASYYLIRKIRESICNSLELPEDLHILNASLAGHDNSLWSNEGLTFIINALFAEPERPLSDIVNDYAEMLKEAVAQYEIEKEQRDAEREARREANGGSSSFLGAMAGAYIGNKFGNGKSQGGSSKYKDYKGSAGCNLSKGSRFSCNMSCNLYSDCIWGRGGKI